MKTSILKQFLAIVFIFILETNSYAQENNPKHNAYVKEWFGIDLTQDGDTTKAVNLLSRSLTPQVTTLSLTTPDTMYVAAKRPYIALNIFDPCGAESKEKCTCSNIFPSVETGPTHTFRVRVQEPTDLLITNCVPGTGIQANRITITGLDSGGTYSSTTDCYDYYNYDGMPESQQLLESILVTGLNNGRYLISITGKKTGNVGSGYGRIETMIITSPSNPDDLELLSEFPEIPLPDGFYFNMPIDMGKYDRAFTYNHNPMVSMGYYAFYSGQGANVVYSFELTGDTPLDINLKVGNGGYIYLLNENREVLTSGVEATTTLPKGKYYCILEDQATDFVDFIPIEISGTVSIGNGNDEETTNSSDGEVEVAPITPEFSKNKNYILTRSYTNNTGTQYLDQIQYFDGLGRPDQVVQIGASPQGHDIVVLQEYDDFNRDGAVWLPIAVQGNNGAYLAPTLIKETAIATYNNDAKPYSLPIYEPAPLNRVNEMYGPGAEWQNESKGVKTFFMTNGEEGHPILKAEFFSCANYGVINKSLTLKGDYQKGELFITLSINEDKNLLLEFKDKLGRVVLMRQVNNGEKYDTYYVYDNSGNLCYVLPPLFIDQATDLSDYSQVMREYAYVYKYDQYNRCIKKRLPGTANDTNPSSGWIYYIYDKADQLIFTQDGEQRRKSPNEWTFNISDIFGRIALVGTCNNVLTVGEEIVSVVHGNFPENANGIYKGYDIKGIALSSTTIHVANFYDDYNFKKMQEVSVLSLNFDETKGAEFNKRYGNDADRVTAKGLQTGKIVATFDEEGINYLSTVMYYDNRGHLIQTQSSNHLKGKESELTAYNFLGAPEKRNYIHFDGKTTMKETYTYSYDKAGRVIKTTHDLDRLSKKLVVENSYDESGRLVKQDKKVVTN